jgi:hypothetical protein
LRKNDFNGVSKQKNKFVFEIDFVIEILKNKLKKIYLVGLKYIFDKNRD